MSDLQNLREKLDQAIATFQKDNRNFDDFKAEHEQLIRISKTFSRFQNVISDNQGKLDEILMRRDRYKDRVKFEINRMRKGIFEDLFQYKELCEKDNISVTCGNNMVLEYKNVIRSKLNVFKLIIQVQEEMVCNKNVEREGSYGSLLNESVKRGGLDPTLYKFYSSSDDLRSEQEIKSQVAEEKIISKDISDKEIQKNMQKHMLKKNEDELQNIEQRIVAAKEEIREEEEKHKFNLKTVHGLKERIHYFFRKMSLYKLQITELMLEQFNTQINQYEKDKAVSDLTQSDVKVLFEKERIRTLFLKFHKLCNMEVKFDVGDDKIGIEKKLLKFEKSILQYKETVNDKILSEVQFILSQGTLEDDYRLLEKIEKQLKEIEKFDTPRFFKLSVQLEITKKYVKDIIYLKQKAFLKNYYNFE